MRVTLTLTLGLLFASIAIGVASARSDLADRVRFVAKPTRVVQGGTVRVVVSVTPAGGRCNAILARGASVLARSAVVRGGSATFTWRLARAAQTGRWKITVLCGSAGSASTSLIVDRPTQPPASIVARVEVDKSGFNVGPFGTNSRQVSFGVVLRNVSPDEDALSVSVTVSAVDAGNRILKSDATTILVVPASGTYYHGGDLIIGGSDQPSRLEVTAQVEERQKKAAALPPVANLRVFDSFRVARVAGEVSNPLTKPLSTFARITVVVFDGAGAVIGGGYTFPSNPVPPGGRIGFETDAGKGVTAAQVASVQASVEPKVD